MLAQRRSDAVGRLAAIGLLAGLFSGIFGVGGGAVAVPLLVLWLGYDERRAAATSLAAIVLIAGVGAAAQAAHGLVSVRDALIVGVPAVGGVLFGTWLQQRVRVTAIAVSFTVVAVVAAVELVLK
ncbi:MAG TPA: sulfite exporter TauE/SafE family protein [Solirubrobacteraceae bacterium]|nr:sulfite exporter TauE/SafE family protein [Solirubrobacteraceae bacterium]